jgi:hypothetical protein
LPLPFLLPLPPTFAFASLPLPFLLPLPPTFAYAGFPSVFFILPQCIA